MSTFSTLLRQDKIWITQDGRRFQVEEMEPGHRANLLAFLRRRAAVLQLMGTVDLVAHVRMPNEDTMAYDSVSDAINREIDMDPGRWLEEQPLMRRLVELEES